MYTPCGANPFLIFELYVLAGRVFYANSIALRTKINEGSRYMTWTKGFGWARNQQYENVCIILKIVVGSFNNNNING